MTAGRDFPEGLYNVKSEPDWNDLMMTLPDSFLSEFAADEEHRVEVISFAPKELELSYENVPIPKGTEIQTTGRPLRLSRVRKLVLLIMESFIKNRQRKCRVRSDSAFQDIIVHDISVSNIRYL